MFDVPIVALLSRADALMWEEKIKRSDNNHPMRVKACQKP